MAMILMLAQSQDVSRKLVTSVGRICTHLVLCVQDDYAPPDTWEADLGTGEMPPDPFAASQAQQLASPQQAPEASGQDPLSQQLSARRSQSTR